MSRAARLGASEIAQVLGLAPWGSPWEVWYRRQPGAEPTPDTPAMAWGRHAEPALVSWAARELGARSVDSSHSAWNGPFWEPSDARWPHLGCHPDAVAVLSDGRTVGIEAKTGRSSADWGDPPDGQIPDAYLLQVQTSLHLTGLEEWWVVAAIRGGPPGMYGPILPDPAIVPALDAAELWAVRHLVEGVEPDILQGGGAMARVSLRWPREETPLALAPEATAALLREFRRLQEARKSAETAEEAAKARLCAAIGDAEGIQTEDGWRARWATPTPRRVLDLDGLLAERPDLAPLVETHRHDAASSRRLTLTAPKRGKE